MIKKFLSRKKIIAVLTGLLIAGIFIYRAFPANNSEKKETAKVVRGTLAENLTVSGTVDAYEKATLQFQTGGKLVWVGVKEGDYVKKYQAVASLDQRQLQKTLSKYLNTYMKSRWDFDQANRDTYRDQVITDTIRRIMDKTQFDLNNSVSDVEIQNIAIELANLTAPIEGIVTKVSMPVSGGNIYLPTDAQFNIVNPKTVYFTATADQTDVVKLSRNMAGELTLDAYPAATFSGSVKDISFVPKTGETNTVYLIKFDFPNDNTDYKYRLGMTGNLVFTVQKKDGVLYLPGKFIRSENGKKYINLLRNGKITRTYVETGLETGENTEITSGVKEGETAVN